MQPSDQDSCDAHSFDGLGRPEIAAEFLRRNQHFRDDQAELAGRVATGKLTAEATNAELAHRWGVSFRRHRRRPRTRPGWAAPLAT
ncbi:transcriptional regulator domain-containing protein [Mycobacterium tuberculosis]